MRLFIKSIFIFNLILWGISALAIVPPKNRDIQIPEEILSNIQKNNQYYMPKRGLIQTMSHYKSQKEQALNPFKKAVNTIRLEGIRTIPVLCGQYANILEEEFAIEDLQEKLFGDWPTGTMTDYYREISGGQFSLSGTVFGWYSLSGDSIFYLRSNDNMDDFIDELLILADSDIDFSLFDNDGPDGQPNSGDDDGYVDAVIFVHSGRGGEEGGDEIWSQCGQYSNYFGTPYISDDSCYNTGLIQIDDFTIQPAIQNNHMVDIGVFCHEFGHTLGLPDLYDRDQSSEGIGYWGVMGSGSWGGDGQSPEKPCHMCGWCKEQVGWIVPQTIKDNINRLKISPVENNQEIFKLWTHGQPVNEYFLIENRQKIGFDESLIESGLLIWHIDNSVTTKNDCETHKLVDLEEADGKDDLDLKRNRGDTGDPFPGCTENHIFNRISRPSSLNNESENTKVAVQNIDHKTDEVLVDCHTCTQDVDYDNYRIEDRGGRINGFLEAGETAELFIRLINYGKDLDKVSATITTCDPALTIIDGSAHYENIPEDGLCTNEDDSYLVSISSDTKKHPLLCTISLSSENNFQRSTDFILDMENTDILLIDDSIGEKDINGADIIHFYQDALDQIPYIYYDTLKVTQDNFPNTTLLNQYGVIIWFTGSRKYTLNNYEQASLATYLDQGGKLFLSGQNIGDELINWGDSEDQYFFKNTLHAELVHERVTDHPIVLLQGISGDPISEPFRPYFFASEGDGAFNQYSPSAIDPNSGATPVFDYFGTGMEGKHAAIKYEGVYKLVYFALSYEAINDLGSRDQIRKKVMERILNWLRGEIVTSNLVYQDEDLITRNIGCCLYQNYPNPFNQRTMIQYWLPERSNVRVTIYNIFGQEIIKLVDQNEWPGLHHVFWSGKDHTGRCVAGGIYIIKMIANDTLVYKKLVLIK